LLKNLSADATVAASWNYQEYSQANTNIWK